MKRFLLLPVVLFIAFCGNKQIKNQKNLWNECEKRKTSFYENANIYYQLDSIPLDFNKFYNRFIKDSTYHLNHISESFIGVSGDCEYTEYLNKNNWNFYSYDFRKDFFNPLNRNSIVLNDSTLLYIEYRIEVGEFQNMGFKKINNEWFLSYYYGDSC
jgi:hypothetical protein